MIDDDTQLPLEERKTEKTHRDDGNKNDDNNDDYKATTRYIQRTTKPPRR